MQLSARAENVVRAAMFAYLGLALCPIYFWPLEGGVDTTWVFALNYARAHHLVIGRDIFWTLGPLSYLGLPMNVGSNFAPAIAFQAATWIVMLTVLWRVFYRSDFALKSLIAFSVLLGISATVSGPDQVLLRSALILFVLYHLGGGAGRYVAALAILGFLPLMKFTWMMASAGAVAGLVVYFVMSRRETAKRDAMLAVIVPVVILCVGLWLTLGSLGAIATFVKASMELSSGFNLAMSLWGAPTEFLAAFEALVLLGIGLALVARRDRKMAWFLILLLAVPLFVSFKHGFVRQDAHIHHYFCFIAVALGLTALVIPLDRERTTVAFAMVTIILALIWQDNVARTGPRFALMSTGLQTPVNLWKALRHGREKRLLESGTPILPPERAIEPEILAIVQHEPIASLSETYTNVYESGLNLVIYPIIQRYSAYTPYLDQLNASWIRDQGPRFLLFDSKPVDGRHPWAETPAMWLEVYRWYDTRLLGARNLLLERRAQPRFTHLETVGRSELRLGDELQFPAASQPVFWSMDCSLTAGGKLRVLLFRVLEVTMTVDKKDRSDVFRVPLAVLSAPSPGDQLPSNLAEFAAVFANSGNGPRSFAVEKLKFGGPGISAYEPTCKVQFLSPVKQ